MQPSLWEEADCDPTAEPHVVHLYRTPGSLHRAVVAWIQPGLEAGGGAALVCARANATRIFALLREDGLNPAALQREGRLTVVFMDEFMPRFLKDGRPDGETFKRLATEVLENVRTSCNGGDVRAWGEMVNLMWKEGNGEGAQHLERLWNEVIAAQGIQLLCSYDVAEVTGEAYTSLWSDVSATHSHLVCDMESHSGGNATGSLGHGIPVACSATISPGSRQLG